ncbi:MAG TPA: amidohydrolase family protein [Spirochaetia bacterium]|nr:amidohydrolase family protein [Spirochaetia bacterium]
MGATTETLPDPFGRAIVEQGRFRGDSATGRWWVMTLDAHWHVIVPEMTREAGGTEGWRPSVRWEDGSQLVELRGRTIPSAVREFVRADRILQEAETLRMDHILICPWVNLIPNTLPIDEALEVCTLQNEGLSAMAAARPNRVSALGVLTLQEPVLAARNLPKLMSLPGMKGVEITAGVGGAYLGDERFLPFWESAEATGALVFIHPTTRGFDLPVFNDYYLWNTVGNPMETTVTAAHMVMAGVMERFPKLKVLLAHGGGGLLALRGRLRHSATFQPQAKARLTGSIDDSFKRFHFDTVTHDPELLRGLVEYVGADRVLLGSDYPFDMGNYRAVEEVRGIGLGRAETEAILGGNAARLIGLEGAQS